MRKLLLFSVFFTSLLEAQQSRTYTIAPAAVNVVPDSREDFNPVLQTIEMPKPAGGTKLQQIKDSLSQVYPKRQNTSQQIMPQSVSPAAPIVNRSFLGNAYNSSTPCDNEIAITNNGSLASVQNSTVFRYRAWNNTNINTVSLTSFFSAAQINGVKYDPKVIYDPEANRFILVCLSGYSSNNTNIMVGFSKTDSINGAWNLYSIPGNPDGDSSWTDYPMLTVNKKELFITINLVYDNQPWQTGFKETLIWQADKWDGYAGDSLILQMHNGINYNGRKIRNMCPVEGGDFPPQTYDMFFLSNRNLDAQNDTVFLIHLTDTINSPNQQITVTPLVSPRPYLVPPNALQPAATGDLQTNDSRILGAFIQNNRIQFVQNTMDTATGFCSVMHGVITDPYNTPTLSADIITDTVELGYPNIAWAGYDSLDNRAMIVCLHASATTFPGVSALTADGVGNYSARTQVKAGTGYINVLSGTDRWGDYSGIQRRYNQLGTFWVNGMFGNTAHNHQTWIAELSVSPDVSVPQMNIPEADAQVYPNPFMQDFNVTFRTDHPQQVKIVVYDLQGNVVRVLLEDRIRTGTHQFSFSMAPLSAGVYLIRGEASEGSVLFTKKVVKQ